MVITIFKNLTMGSLRFPYPRDGNNILRVLFKCLLPAAENFHVFEILLEQCLEFALRIEVIISPVLFSPGFPRYEGLALRSMEARLVAVPDGNEHGSLVPGNAPDLLKDSFVPVEFYRRQEVECKNSVERIILEGKRDGIRSREMHIQSPFLCVFPCKSQHVVREVGANHGRVRPYHMF